MPDQTDQNAPDLIASTGTNDPNSPWNGLLQTALTDATQIGSSALQKALNAQTPLTNPTNGNGVPVSGVGTPAGPSSASHKYLPWILGGAIVAVIAWLLFRGK